VTELAGAGIMALIGGISWGVLCFIWGVEYGKKEKKK